VTPFETLPDADALYAATGPAQPPRTGVTISALLFGDYPKLALRCLEPLLGVLPCASVARLLVWTNAVGPDTLAYLEERVAPQPKVEWLNKGGPNYLKYPALRAMLYRPPGIETEFLMHFDDDSYIREERPDLWLERTLARARREHADMLGSTWTLTRPLSSRQCDWVQSRKWYTGRSVRPPYKPTFFTGGWWLIRTELLYRHDWPPAELRHRGGDVMLGQLCRQQGYKTLRYRDGVAINADEHGKESRQPRRGFNERPVGDDRCQLA